MVGNDKHISTRRKAHHKQIWFFGATGAIRPTNIIRLGRRNLEKSPSTTLAIKHPRCFRPKAESSMDYTGVGPEWVTGEIHANSMRTKISFPVQKCTLIESCFLIIVHRVFDYEVQFCTQGLHCIYVRHSKSPQARFIPSKMKFSPRPCCLGHHQDLCQARE